MKGAGYNTHGKIRYRAKEMCSLNESFTDSAAKKELCEKKKPEKGPKATTRELYINIEKEENREDKIKKFNEYANKLIKMGYKKDIILSWIEDLIKPEDKIIEKIGTEQYNGEKNDDNESR